MSVNETPSTSANQSRTKTPETVNDNSKVTATTPINRKLEFADDNSPLPNNAINM